VVVNVFVASATVVLNHFAERSQIQINNFVREPHKEILPQVNWHVCYTKFLSCYWKALPMERNSFQAQNQTLSSYRVYISP